MINIFKERKTVEQVEEAYFTVQFRDEKGKADSSSKSFKNASAAKKHADMANKTTKVGSYSVQKVQGRMESVDNAVKQRNAAQLKLRHAKQDVRLSKKQERDVDRVKEDAGDPNSSAKKPIKFKNPDGTVGVKMVPAHQDVQTEGLDVKSGNESGGYYHTSFHTKHGKNEPKTKKGYVKTHATVKKLTGAKDAHARDYLDSKRGRHLVGKEADHGYIKKDFAKFSKTYKASDYQWESVEEACWDSHKQVGTKEKGGKTVPNCVPKNESEDYLSTTRINPTDGKGKGMVKQMPSKKDFLRGRKGRQTKAPRLRREDVEQVDELSVGTLSRYNSKASKDPKRAKMNNKAVGKIVKKTMQGESVEQVDEVKYGKMPSKDCLLYTSDAADE